MVVDDDDDDDVFSGLVYPNLGDTGNIDDEVEAKEGEGEEGEGEGQSTSTTLTTALPSKTFLTFSASHALLPPTPPAE